VQDEFPIPHIDPLAEFPAYLYEMGNFGKSRFFMQNIVIEYIANSRCIIKRYLPNNMFYQLILRDIQGCIANYLI